MFENILTKVHKIPSLFKFYMCIIFCLVIHGSLIVFGKVFDVKPLMLFNIFSVTVYFMFLFIVKKSEIIVYYFAFVEVAIHSFICVMLLGNKFGFSMYFILFVPMSYNMLHSVNSKNTFQKATVMAVISFILYCFCYFISESREPIYQSAALDAVAPYVYVINIFITYMILTVFSIFFLLETEQAFGALNDKNKELGILANTDPLTGLYNRRTMAEHVKQFYSNYLNDKHAFSLIICDIDDFKNFNDTYGHDCGDEVLKAITNTLSSLTREHDYLCRWGGEEFLILLDQIEVEKAKEIAERFRSSIEKTEIYYGELKIHITMTFGVACVKEAVSYNDLFKIADKRLYKGKNSGKNCVV